MIGTGEPLDGRASITLGLNGCVAEALTLFGKLR